MTPELLLNVVEAALLAAGRPVDVDELLGLFADQSPPPDRKQMRAALDNLQVDLEGRALELKQVAGGYRLQVREEYSKLLGGLFTERHESRADGRQLMPTFLVAPGNNGSGVR